VTELGVLNPGLFALTVLVVNATPGVDLLYTGVCTLRHGRGAGIAAAFGIASGCVVHALAATFGLAALLAASSWAFGAVKWAGAVYLLWLAVGMWRSAAQPKPFGASQDAPSSSGIGVAGSAALPPSNGAVFRRGALTNILNPKVALFFLALLPQFIAAEAPDKTLAFLVLGAWFVVQGGLFLIAFAVLVSPLARRPAPDRLRRGLEAAGGALFALLALRLAGATR
jgi:threonine/homoserine/homoserine lactone efflux protein